MKVRAVSTIPSLEGKFSSTGAESARDPRHTAFSKKVHLPVWNHPYPDERNPARSHRAPRIL